MKPFLILPLLFHVSGCVPLVATAAVGGAIYHSAKTNDQRTQFTLDLQRQNIEREKAKLRPLDWCSEAYKFDKSYAKENAECASRIARFEGGDASALDR